jgi:hypothetical protein
MCSFRGFFHFISVHFLTPQIYPDPPINSSFKEEHLYKTKFRLHFWTLKSHFLKKTSRNCFLNFEIISK